MLGDNPSLPLGVCVLFRSSNLSFRLLITPEPAGAPAIKNIEHGSPPLLLLTRLLTCSFVCPPLPPLDIFPYILSILSINLLIYLTRRVGTSRYHETRDTAGRCVMWGGRDVPPRSQTQDTEQPLPLLRLRATFLIHCGRQEASLKNLTSLPTDTHLPVWIEETLQLRSGSRGRIGI